MRILRREKRKEKRNRLNDWSGRRKKTILSQHKLKREKKREGKHKLRMALIHKGKRREGRGTASGLGRGEKGKFSGKKKGGARSPKGKVFFGRGKEKEGMVVNLVWKENENSW